jgi:hypothetical protein
METHILDIPSTPFDGEQLKQALGAQSVYSENGKIIVVGEVTLEQVASGMKQGRDAWAAKKAEKDAIEVQFAKDRADGEAKLLAVGLTIAQVKAIRGEKARVL